MNGTSRPITYKMDTTPYIEESPRRSTAMKKCFDSDSIGTVRGANTCTVIGRKLRRRSGSAIAEAGPALMVLILVTFIPMIDLLYYAFGYGAAFYLHQLEARAVSVSQLPVGPNSQFPGESLSEVSGKKNAFINSGLGRFLHLSETQCLVQTLPDPNNSTVVGTSVLTNQFHVQGLLFLPSLKGFNNIPALNGQGITFSFSTAVLQEEKGLN